MRLSLRIGAALIVSAAAVAASPTGATIEPLLSGVHTRRGAGLKIDDLVNGPPPSSSSQSHRSLGNATDLIGLSAAAVPPSRTGPDGRLMDRSSEPNEEVPVKGPTRSATGVTVGIVGVCLVLLLAGIAARLVVAFSRVRFAPTAFTINTCILAFSSSLAIVSLSLGLTGAVAGVGREYRFLSADQINQFARLMVFFSATSELCYGLGRLAHAIQVVRAAAVDGDGDERPAWLRRCSHAGLIASALVSLCAFLTNTFRCTTIIGAFVTWAQPGPVATKHDGRSCFNFSVRSFAFIGLDVVVNVALYFILPVTVNWDTHYVRQTVYFLVWGAIPITVGSGMAYWTEAVAVQSVDKPFAAAGFVIWKCVAETVVLLVALANDLPLVLESEKPVVLFAEPVVETEWDPDPPVFDGRAPVYVTPPPSQPKLPPSAAPPPPSPSASSSSASSASILRRLSAFYSEKSGGGSCSEKSDKTDSKTEISSSSAASLEVHVVPATTAPASVMNPQPPVIFRHSHLGSPPPVSPGGEGYRSIFSYVKPGVFGRTGPSGREGRAGSTSSTTADPVPAPASPSVEPPESPRRWISDRFRNRRSRPGSGGKGGPGLVEYLRPRRTPIGLGLSDPTVPGTASSRRRHGPGEPATPTAGVRPLTRGRVPSDASPRDSTGSLAIPPPLSFRRPSPGTDSTMLNPPTLLNPPMTPMTPITPMTPMIPGLAPRTPTPTGSDPGSDRPGRHRNRVSGAVYEVDRGSWTYQRESGVSRRSGSGSDVVGMPVPEEDDDDYDDGGDGGEEDGAGSDPGPDREAARRKAMGVLEGDGGYDDVTDYRSSPVFGAFGEPSSSRRLT